MSPGLEHASMVLGGNVGAKLSDLQTAVERLADVLEVDEGDRDPSVERIAREDVRVQEALLAQAVELQARSLGRDVLTELLSGVLPVLARLLAGEL